MCSNKWISTKDRVPGTIEDVVFVEKGDIYPRIGRYYRGNWGAYDHRGILHHVEEEVDYWLPIPQWLPDRRRL